MATNIQEIWLIEEKAIIFLSLVWLSPPIAPIKAESEINIIVSVFISTMNESKIMGVIFCQVIIIEHLIQDKPSITLGNQK